MKEEATKGDRITQIVLDVAKEKRDAAQAEGKTGRGLELIVAAIGNHPNSNYRPGRAIPGDADDGLETIARHRRRTINPPTAIAGRPAERY